MTDEPTMVHATHGPYAGQRLTMKKADAASAIADGWAIDPFKQPPDEPREITAEERQKILERAHQAAAVLRGEHNEEKHDEHRDMSAEHGGDYKTRDAKARK
jgi:hypothetical protein